MDIKDERPKEVLVQDHLLVTLESAYPNILPMEDLAQYVWMRDEGWGMVFIGLGCVLD